MVFQQTIYTLHHMTQRLSFIFYVKVLLQNDQFHSAAAFLPGKESLVITV